MNADCTSIVSDGVVVLHYMPKAVHVKIDDSYEVFSKRKFVRLENETTNQTLLSIVDVVPNDALLSILDLIANETLLRTMDLSTNATLLSIVHFAAKETVLSRQGSAGRRLTKFASPSGGSAQHPAPPGLPGGQARRRHERQGKQTLGLLSGSAQWTSKLHRPVRSLPLKDGLRGLCTCWQSRVSWPTH